MAVAPLAWIVLVVALAWAVREDMLRNRIPNELNLAAILVAFGLAYYTRGTDGLMSSLAGVAVGGGALMPFYLLRGMGAGDVKLMAAAGAFLGPSDALFAAALAIVLGGVIGVGIVACRIAQPKALFDSWSHDRSSVVLRMFATISATRKERFPYAIAIAAGVVTALALRGSLGEFYSAWTF